MPPVVSIIIPCFNSAATLPLAISSVIAQTYQNWECIIIDDGSNDDPQAAISTLKDKRIRHFKFNKNRGRGAARQYGLEQANGEFLAMVDADDWLYPEKLEKQIEIMVSEPHAVMVAGPLAITDRKNEIVGVRSGITVKAPYCLHYPSRSMIKPLFTHAPSMLRIEVVRKEGYRVDIKVGEDAEFLMRVIQRYPVAIMKNITYVYSEYGSAGASKSIMSLINENRALLQYWRRNSYAVTRDYLLNLLKIPCIATAFSLGLGNALVARRSRLPTPAEIDAFKAAKLTVSKILEKYFSGRAW
jgi:glycosyltransferase involved in cell wall biosynthesis